MNCSATVVKSSSVMVRSLGVPPCAASTVAPWLMRVRFKVSRRPSDDCGCCCDHGSAPCVHGSPWGAAASECVCGWVPIPAPPCWLAPIQFPVSWFCRPAPIQFPAPFGLAPIQFPAPSLKVLPFRGSDPIRFPAPLVAVEALLRGHSLPQCGGFVMRPQTQQASR